MHHFFASVRQSSVMKAIRNILSTWPGYQNYPGNVRFHNVKSKVRCLLTLLSATIRMTEIERVRLKNAKKQKNRFLGKAVLVLGNGPSINSLDLAKVIDFQKRGGVIAAMNDFPLARLSKYIIPDLYFIGDPIYWDGDETMISKETKGRIWNALDSIQNLIIFQPNNREQLIPSKETIYLDHRSMAGLFRSSNPIKPWGLPASIAMITIATCKFLGFSQIYFAGLDSTMHFKFFVNSLNELGFDTEGHYFDPSMVSMEQSVVFDIDWPVKNLADVYYAQAVFLSDLKTLCIDDCINVGSDNTNDAAWRGCLI